MLDTTRRKSRHPSLGSDFVTVKLSQLRVGATLRSPIYDGAEDSQQLLLAAKSTLTAGQLEVLRSRGVTEVRVHHTELERLTTGGSRSAGALSSSQRMVLRQAASAAEAKAAFEKRPGIIGWRCERESFQHKLHRPDSLSRNQTLGDQFQQSYEQTVNAATAMFDDLVVHGAVNSQQLTEFSSQQLEQLAEDCDEFVSRALLPITADYPSRHSVQTSMLSTSIGCIMGLRRDELLQLGAGCLLHDAGMLLIPEHLRRATGTLNTADRLELQKHPILALDLLSDNRDISHPTKMVVHQMHERMNGTGYPRQRVGSQIHPYARIAAVADTYLAMVSPRPFRPGMEPYQAVEKLLFATRQGLFDPGVMRALLHAVSLFPIGSTVRLSDGRMGRVVRGNRDQFARPVIEVLDLNQPNPSPEVLDLSHESALSIIGTSEPVSIA